MINCEICDKEMDSEDELKECDNCGIYYCSDCESRYSFGICEQCHIIDEI